MLESFIVKPNLPVGRVSLAAVPAGERKIIRALEGHHIAALALECCYALPAPVQGHTDMMLNHLGGSRVLISPHNQENVDRLMGRGFSVKFISESLTDNYPGDALLDSLIINHSCFFHEKATAQEIKDYCELNNILLYPVKQGYIKCSVCIVDEASFITSDSGIAAAGTRAGFNVLEISTGHIMLPGYEYGFIGGCSGLLAPDLLAFTGDITKHPDYISIRDFAGRRQVKLVSLTSDPLKDIGSIIPLMEIPLGESTQTVRSEKTIENVVDEESVI